MSVTAKLYNLIMYVCVCARRRVRLGLKMRKRAGDRERFLPAYLQKSEFIKLKCY